MTVTLIFGGTFDPVHNGHLCSARELITLFDDARIVLVPCQIPAHRPVPATPAEDRLQMLRLATAGIDRVDVDDCELNRDGVSYSFDTLCHYRQSLPDEPLFFVMGKDAWLTLPTWHRWQAFCDIAHLLVIERPDGSGDIDAELAAWSADKVAGRQQATEHAFGNIVFESLTQYPVSATEIRRKRQQGEPISELVPDAVDRYITSRHLYL